MHIITCLYQPTNMVPAATSISSQSHQDRHCPKKKIPARHYFGLSYHHIKSHNCINHQHHYCPQENIRGNVILLCHGPKLKSIAEHNMVLLSWLPNFCHSHSNVIVEPSYKAK